MKRIAKAPQLIVETFRRDLMVMWDHLMDDGWPGFFPWMVSKEAPPIVQFAKYALFGAVTTVVHNVIVVALGCTVLPAFPGLMGEPIPTELRQHHLLLANLIAFPVGNVVAYLGNVMWVFTPGRHSKWREFWLFTGIAAFSFGVGLFGGPILIGWFGISSGLAQIGLIVTSALVNFVCRKFLVFSK